MSNDTLRLKTLFSFGVKLPTSHKNTSVLSEPTNWLGITDNTMSIIKTTGLFFFHMFKVIMATLLSLFVPQKCPADEENGFPEDHSCTDQENIGAYGLEPYEEFVLIWNFITMGFALLNYLLVMFRERRLINYLSYDPSVDQLHLPKVLENYPEIKHVLHKINFIVMVSSISTILIFIVNVIVSGIMIIGTYSDGYRTITVFITNMLLMMNILYITVGHAYVGYYNEYGLSCFEFEPLSYNVIDELYRKNEHMEDAGQATDAMELPTV